MKPLLKRKSRPNGSAFSSLRSLDHLTSCPHPSPSEGNKADPPLFFEFLFFIPVVGIDAIPDAIKRIKEGTMVGTVLNDANNQAKAIIDLATNAANGKNILSGTSWKLDNNKSVRVHYVTIIKDNTDIAEQAYK